MLPTIIGGAVLLGGAALVNWFIQDDQHSQLLAEEERKREVDEEKRLLDSGIYKVDNMTGQEFEQLLSLCYRKLGFKVQLTPASQDFGADLILYKDDIKLIVQAKRYKVPVGIKAVQEVVGAIKHYRGNKGMVITNSSFTDSTCALARSLENANS